MEGLPGSKQCERMLANQYIKIATHPTTIAGTPNILWHVSGRIAVDAKGLNYLKRRLNYAFCSSLHLYLSRKTQTTEVQRVVAAHSKLQSGKIVISWMSISGMGFFLKHDIVNHLIFLSVGSITFCYVVCGQVSLESFHWA